MIDILFCAHGRPEFTRASLKALCDNTDNAEVGTGKVRLHVYTDGEAVDLNLLGHDSVFAINSERHGGPVACLRSFLENSIGHGEIAKIDNDTIVPPGWLEASLDVMRRYPGVDLLGLEAWSPEPQLFPRWTKPEPAGHSSLGIFQSDQPRIVSHIGGMGLFRRSSFDRFGLPKPNTQDGRFGFTEWQWDNPAMLKAFLDPPLPVFLLDHLPFEPWRSLSARYEAEGVQRRQWGFYDADKHKALWEWWKP